MSGKRVLSSEDARPAEGQHKKPCSDCPWARASMNGWLGGLTIDEWLNEAHGEARIECHTLEGAQCAGASIYRANTAKLPRDRSLLRLPSDHGLVFSNRREFSAHHEAKPKL